MRSRAKLASLSVTAALTLFAAACGGGSGGEGEGEGEAQSGGSLTVLMQEGYSGDWPAGLDPATNSTGGANLSQMYAIFGGLFKLTGGEGGEAEVVGGLATGYEFSNEGKTVTISLREGVTFSDGTPFNAEAVAWNFERDVGSPCSCAPTWPLKEKNAITTPDEHTVQLHFTRPYAAVIHALLVSNANWIASPSAFEEMGEKKFKQKPVGAGPFKIVSNTPGSELVLEANPNYWKEGRPYLDQLTFKTIGGDQAGYQALLAGGAHAYEGMTSVPLVEQASNNDRLVVTQQPPTSPYVIQLNTMKAPFDNIRAREAIYYATNVAAISEGLFDGRYPVSQMFTGPGGLFHHAEVPGYRTYDLERAKSIVEEIGGLEITLGTLKAPLAEKVNTALQSQWQKAGIDVKIESYTLQPLVDKFESGDWDAMLQTAGSWDPEAGVGVPFRFESNSPFTGVKDKKLDDLLRQAAATLDEEKRDQLYFEAGKYISDQAYAPFLFAFAPASVVVEGVQGPGLTTKIPPLLVAPTVLWEEVRMSQ